MITLTENAADKITEMMKSTDKKLYLRIGVQYGGCSGFSYDIGFVQDKQDTDAEFEQYSITVVVHEEDLKFLGGTVIDYKDAAMGGGFVIDNPNATLTCGCGTSFRTEKDSGNAEKC